MWSHPSLTPNLLGGFTTQNTDAEWSDARQAVIAPALFAYYKALAARSQPGALQYLQRGVAALRVGRMCARARVCVCVCVCACE